MPARESELSIPCCLQWSLRSLVPAGTVQQHLQSLFLSAVGWAGGCSAGHEEGFVEADGFPVFCRVFVAPENQAVSSTSVHQNLSLHRLGLPSHTPA